MDCLDFVVEERYKTEVSIQMFHLNIKSLNYLIAFDDKQHCFTFHCSKALISEDN